MTSTDPWVIRPATVEDAAEVAEVYLASRRAAFPAMPAGVHPDDDVRAWLAGRLAARGEDEVWVVEQGERLLGYARFTATWLDDLYVRPEVAGQGLGSALVDLVKSLRPGGFALWVFESNLPARRFYRRHGLRERERTDGSENEEQAPDLRMSWDGGECR